MIVKLGMVEVEEDSGEVLKFAAKQVRWSFICRSLDCSRSKELSTNEEGKSKKVVLKF
jgi:hypothetical protein